SVLLTIILLAPREDSRTLGARAARPLPARHSAGVIAFAALARVVAKSGRAARAPRTRCAHQLGCGRQPALCPLWSKGPLSPAFAVNPPITEGGRCSGLVVELERQRAVRRGTAGPQRGRQQHGFGDFLARAAGLLGRLGVYFDAVHALRGVRDR